MKASSPDIILLRRDARDLLNPKNSQELHTNLLESVYEPIMNAMLSSGSLSAQSIDRLVDSFVIGATGLSRTYAMNSHSPRETAHWWAKHFLHGATAA